MIMMEEHPVAQTGGGLHLMLAELESNQLEIQLVPCRRRVNEGGCIRVAVSRNTDWYRKFCAAHSSTRVRRKSAHDTCIKRANTIRVLTRLAEGLPTRSKYAAEFQRIAKKFS
jgi:hypothetical protein